MRRENEQKLYRTVFELLSDGLIISDLETGKVVEANPASCALYGYVHEELVGLPLMSLMQHHSYAQFAASAEAIEQGNVFEATTLNLRQDGSSFTGDVRGTPLIYRDRPCLLSVIRHVSAKVQAEQLLRQQTELIFP